MGGGGGAPFHHTKNQSNTYKPELETQEVCGHEPHWPVRTTEVEYLLKDLYTSCFQMFGCVCVWGEGGGRGKVFNYCIS